MGEYLAGPLFDQEGVLLAELDLAEVIRGKFDLDVVGHYARPDVFQLIVNEPPTPWALGGGGNDALVSPETEEYGNDAHP
jgi:hypothetical protein